MRSVAESTQHRQPPVLLTGLDHIGIWFSCSQTALNFIIKVSIFSSDGTKICVDWIRATAADQGAKVGFIWKAEHCRLKYLLDSLGHSARCCGRYLQSFPGTSSSRVGAWGLMRLNGLRARARRLLAFCSNRLQRKRN